MARLTYQELAAAQSIFNHVVNVVGQTHAGYHGPKMSAEIRNFVSSNKWIMFPIAGVGSLREAVSYPTPNVYTSFHGNVEDDGQGLMKGYIGLSFNNSGAMQWLAQLLTRRNAPHFLPAINALGDEWVAEISQKIKTCHQDNASRYRTMKVFHPRDLTASIIKDEWERSDGSLFTCDDDFEGEPVLWSITNFSVWKEVTPASFDADIRTIFDLFFHVLTLR